MLCFVSNSEDKLDIKLTGLFIKEKMLSVYQFNCSTNKSFQGCHVEFLVNGKTQETLRYYSNTCYNGAGVCKAVQCACSSRCNSFTWNFTNEGDKENQIFACESRIEDNHVVYQAFSSVIFKGGRMYISINIACLCINDFRIQKVKKPNHFMHILVNRKPSLFWIN